MISAHFIRTESARVNKLCAGHYDIKKYHALLKKEYGSSEGVARKYSGRMPPMIADELAVKLIGYLVKTLKVKRLKRIILNSPEAKLLGGMYVDKEIHLPGEWIRTSTLLHEFTHHVCQVEKYSDGHGPKFCEMLELVYQAAMEHLGGIK